MEVSKCYTCKKTILKEKLREINYGEFQGKYLGNYFTYEKKEKVCPSCYEDIVSGKGAPLPAIDTKGETNGL